MKYRIITNELESYAIQYWGIPNLWISRTGRPAVDWWTLESCCTLRKAKKRLELIIKKNEAEAEIMAKAGQVVYEVESFT